jgi:hypothetical protein
MLTKVAGYGVWGLVVMLIVSMIFRVAATYLGMLESALKF